MKIAIIGSGAAALAAAHAARRANRSCHIDIIEPPSDYVEPPLARKDHRAWTREEFAQLHADIRRACGFGFPPPKTHFGHPIARHAARHKTVWRSTEPGGLTNFWSASLLPFTDAELAGWPVNRRMLDPFYRAMAAVVGIAATPDRLDEYFGESFATQPPTPVTPLAKKLVDEVNAHTSSTEFKLLAGVNRLGIDTLPESARSCVACGGCFYGCFRRSIFNARTRMSVDASALNLRFTRSRVLKLARERDGHWSAIGDAGTYSGYSKIFCAAGCVGSSEIVLRTLAGSSTPQPLLDNDLYYFPILYFGRELEGDVSQYLAIANVVVGFVPVNGDHHYAELHVAPVPDYLLAYYFPGFAQDFVRSVSRRLRARVLLGKLYLHSDCSGRSTLYVDDDGVRIDGDTTIRSRQAAATAMATLQAHLGPKGFYVVRQPQTRSSTSSHYAASLHAFLPGGDAHRTGEILPGLHVVDSSIFPASPAPPPTFTIMANAYRIVSEALNG